MNFAELSPLECVLSDCEYKSENNQVKCGHLCKHLELIQEELISTLPKTFVYKINAPIRNQNKANGSFDLCVSMCLADVVQFYNSSTEIISDKSIWHHRNSFNANGMYILEGIQIVKDIG